MDPLFDLAVIQDASGRRAAAQKALERAVVLQPANPETWRRLGNFRLNALQDPEGARGALRAALYLDPNSVQATSDYLLAGRAIVAREQAKAAAAQLKAARKAKREAAKAAAGASTTP